MNQPPRNIFKILSFSAFLLLPSTSLYAQQAVDQTVIGHAMSVSKVCPGAWETQACLKAMSLSNQDLAVNYASAVKNAGHEAEIENVKQVCAASTAATEGDYPAYAMKSAFTECANGIYDISERTGVKPDPSHYQLLIGSVMCLSQAKECAGLEQQMRTMAQ